MRRWRLNWSWRPLARRDAIRRPVYDRYLRGQPPLRPSPRRLDPLAGQHQDGPDGRRSCTSVVQEYVLNTYPRCSDYDAKAAEDYWAATKGYWAAIRAEWDRHRQRQGRDLH